MVRTRADGIKATGAKAPRKVAVSSPRGSTTKGKERGGGGSGGGNAYNPQPVPTWQRPVASFFTAVPRTADGAGGSSAGSAGGSSSSSSAAEPPAEPSGSPPPQQQEEVEVVDAAGTSGADNFSSNGLISDEDE